MQSTVVDDAAGLPVGSKARFAVYRPELPGIGDPLNFSQAKGQYRKKFPYEQFANTSKNINQNRFKSVHSQRGM